MKNIVLIGFMGCGKSSVGRYYASHHKMKQIDTDHYIEKKEKRKISEIFAAEGEEAFRIMETETMRELCHKNSENIVLSVGGGLPMREENQKLLREFGSVIYLKTDVETLIKRLSYDKSRPLLQGGDLREKITKLMEQRESTYEAIADCIITTDGKNFAELEREILLATEGFQ